MWPLRTMPAPMPVPMAMKTKLRVPWAGGVELAEGGDIDVVVDGGGDVEGFFEQGLQGDVGPAKEVGGGEDDAAVCVGDAGCSGGAGGEA